MVGSLCALNIGFRFSNGNITKCSAFTQISIVKLYFFNFLQKMPTTSPGNDEPDGEQCDRDQAPNGSLETKPSDGLSRFLC
ncbi:MAG: hypothetical protein EAZ42_12750 [Verrucomicrobia bacterium]|nr:MAG: hypothetical protein EAZ42_12750 [Verrucomicrobiota bacterium]